MKSILSTFMVGLLLMMSLTSCSTKTSDLVSALNTVADSASVAVVVTSSLVALGKIDPEIGEQVSAYAQGVGTAVNVSIAELNSTTSTNPQKIAAISAAFAKVATPAFGTKAPQISATIDTVSAAIKIFISRLNSNGLLKAANAAPTAEIKLEGGDKALLKEIQKKTAKTLETAETLKQ